MTRAILGLFLFGAAAAAQDAKPQAGFVDQAKVDKAISKGLEYLKTAKSPGSHKEIQNSDELILLTEIHGGASETDPAFQDLLKRCLDAKLERTYKVALLAMCLEELDRAKYQKKIAACGQFLLDNECANGQWSYGEPTVYAEDVPTGVERKEVASAGGSAAKSGLKTFDAPGARVKPPVKKKVPLKQNKTGPATGDNSNSQYAALGVRACHDAGIVFPKDAMEKARSWWETSQCGVMAGAKPAEAPAVATGAGPAMVLGDPRGWCYKEKDAHPAYSSMTTGAIGAEVIFDYILGKDWRKDKVVQDGMAWLAANFSVTENVGPAQTAKGAKNGWLYYYLYAIERAGMLYDTATIGSHDWYVEGAKVLLDAQKADGSWDGSHTKQPAWDTCFAILFLKRATRPLVATEGGGGKK
jgi:hypothetical protein